MAALTPKLNLQNRPIEDSAEILVCQDTTLALSVASTMILSAAESARLIVVSKTKYAPGMHYRALLQSNTIPTPPMAPPLPRVVALSYDWYGAPGSEGKPDALLATLESSFLDGYDWAVIDLSGIEPSTLNTVMRRCRDRVPENVAVLFLCHDSVNWIKPLMTIDAGVLTWGNERYAIRPETVVLSPFRENGRPVSVEVHKLQAIEADGQIRFTPLPWV